MEPNNKIELYGFCGKLGTGKNFIAENLFFSQLPAKPTLVMAMADQIKINCCVKDREPFDNLFLEKTESSRRLLQKRGTEEGRDVYGEDIWIRYIDNWIKVYASRGIQRFIVTDLRFPNEVAWCKSRGGHVIGIIAPERNFARLAKEARGDPKKIDEISKHPSELLFDTFINECDYLIYNDLNEQATVKQQITRIIESLSI